MTEADNGSDANQDRRARYNRANDGNRLRRGRQEHQQAGPIRVQDDEICYGLDVCGHVGFLDANSSTTLRPGSLSASLTVIPWMSATAATSDNPSPLPAVDRLRSSLKKR